MSSAAELGFQGLAPMRTAASGLVQAGSFPLCEFAISFLLYVQEKDEMLRCFLAEGVWHGYMLGAPRNEHVAGRFCGRESDTCNYLGV